MAAGSNPKRDTHDPHETFLRLWMHHEPPLRAFVRSCCPNAQEVDDVMQEVSLAVIRQNGHPNDRSRIRAWLYRIVVRRAADYMRGKYRQKMLVETLGDESAENASDPDWVLASERGEQLREALSACQKTNVTCLS